MTMRTRSTEICQIEIENTSKTNVLIMFGTLEQHNRRRIQSSPWKEMQMLSIDIIQVNKRTTTK
jgi:hypothetical protein